MCGSSYLDHIEEKLEALGVLDAAEGEAVLGSLSVYQEDAHGKLEKRVELRCDACVWRVCVCV